MKIDEIREMLDIQNTVINELRINLRKKMVNAVSYLTEEDMEELIDVAVSTIYEGVEIKVRPKECSVTVGNFHVMALNRQGVVATEDNTNGDPLTVDNFLVACPIDPLMIKSIEFPVFDYSCCNTLLDIKVTVFPFQFKPFTITETGRTPSGAQDETRTT